MATSAPSRSRVASAARTASKCRAPPIAQSANEWIPLSHHGLPSLASFCNGRLEVSSAAAVLLGAVTLQPLKATTSTTAAQQARKTLAIFFDSLRNRPLHAVQEGATFY